MEIARTVKCVSACWLRLACATQGFELNAEQWLPRNMLVTTKAMQAWAQKRAVDGQWHASSHAGWARLSARAAEHPVDKKAEIDSGRFQQVLC